MKKTKTWPIRRGVIDVFKDIAYADVVSVSTRPGNVKQHKRHIIFESEDIDGNRYNYLHLREEDIFHAEDDIYKWSNEPVWLLTYLWQGQTTNPHTQPGFAMVDNLNTKKLASFIRTYIRRHKRGECPNLI